MTHPSSAAIEIVHRFDARVEAVWRAWTDPSVVRGWWGSDPDGVVTGAELDVRNGGRFEISFRDPSGDEHTSSGEYLNVAPLRELDFTWGWRSEPGVFSRVTVQFTADGGGTRMRFVHGELGGPTLHDYAAGWRRTFAKLDRVLAEGPGQP